MSAVAPRERDPAEDARLAAHLLAIDPHGLGGAHLRARAGPARDAWIACLRAALPAEAPVRPLPRSADDDRVAGGLDLAATLAGGRPVVARGLLASADGGVVLLAMAERADAIVLSRLASMLDRGAVDPAAGRATDAARAAVVALDEGIDDERAAPALVDRLAFAPDLDALTFDALEPDAGARGAVAQARARLPRVVARESALEALCAGALALGIDSIRAPILALRAARANAAWRGNGEVDDEDLRAAARLVLAPRAAAIPPAAGDEPRDAPEAAPETPPATGDEASGEAEASSGRELADSVVEAARAAIPADLLAALAGRASSRSRTRGRHGALRRSGVRGRPGGVRAGKPGAGARLALLATLRAAVPWRRLREGAPRPGAAARIEVRAGDLRVTRFKERTETTTVFVVDASGSSALHRLAEAKGAVELMLAESYVRRDRVALVTFRGKEASLALPPTRSLTRAKRLLAALPGGGGTPLASGLELAAQLAAAVSRRGGSASIVLLTDGGANVARDGTPGRARAAEDALAAAARIAASGAASVVVDTGLRPQDASRELARRMAARYLALPHADAAALATAIRSPR